MTKDISGGGGLFDVLFTARNTFIGFVLTIALLFIASWIAAAAALPEAITSLLVAAITYLCIGVCGFRAARHSGSNGLLSGAIAGFIYVVLLYFVGSLVYGELGFTYASALTAIICVMCGAIGGIVGINARPKRRR